MLIRPVIRRLGVLQKLYIYNDISKNDMTRFHTLFLPTHTILPSVLPIRQALSFFLQLYLFVSPLSSFSFLIFYKSSCSYSSNILLFPSSSSLFLLIFHFLFLLINLVVLCYFGKLIVIPRKIKAKVK